MMPAAPASRTRRSASRSFTPPATRRSTSADPRERRELGDLGLAGRVAEHEPSDAAAGELGDEVRQRGRRRPVPRERGEPVRPRVEPDREPVAGDLEARPQERRVVGEREAGHDARRAGGERDLDRLGRVEAAGELERRRDARGDRADRVGVHRGAAPGAVEVDEVDERRAEAHEVLGDPLRPVGRCADAGRDAGPEHDPRPAALEVDRRDDLHEPLPARSGRCGPRRAAPGGGS